MAAFFAGRKSGFDPTWSGPGSFGAHHYARPLQPWLAGQLARAVPALGLRTAFSLVSVVAAWAVAAALYLFLAGHAPRLVLPWLPAALFLTGFPQIDWGYHLLTDSTGYATALIAAIATWHFLEARRGRPLALGDGRAWLALAGLFLLQSVAFLARETALFVPLVALWLLWRRGFPGRETGTGVAVLGALGLALVPRSLYVRHFALHPLGFYFWPSAWIAPGYVADFLVKSAVAFHVFWALAARALRKRELAGAPELLIAWAMGALLYIGAGYVRNTLDGIGYPLRLTYGLFPLLYYLTARALERGVPDRRLRLAALLLVALNGAIGVVGTLLDRGATVTVPSLLSSARAPRR